MSLDAVYIYVTYTDTQCSRFSGMKQQPQLYLMLCGCNSACVILNAFVRAGIYYSLRAEDREDRRDTVEKKIPCSAVSRLTFLNTGFQETEICLSSAQKFLHIKMQMLKLDYCGFLKVLGLTLPCACCQREYKDLDWRVIADIRKFYSQYKEVKTLYTKNYRDERSRKRSCTHGLG